MVSRIQQSTSTIVQSGNLSEAGLFAIYHLSCSMCSWSSSGQIRRAYARALQDMLITHNTFVHSIREVTTFNRRTCSILGIQINLIMMQGNHFTREVYRSGKRRAEDLGGHGKSCDPSFQDMGVEEGL